jgi:hypothetical protein
MSVALPGAGFSPGSTSWEQSSDTLTIGTVAFLDEEHPSELDFTQPEALSIQQNIGGSRTIQDLGPNPKDVTWSGQLFDQNMKPRFAALNAMRAAAVPVSLTYLDQAFLVVVRSITKKYAHRWRGGYEITVSILQDLTSNSSTATPPSTDSQVNGLTQAAIQEIANLVALDSTGTVAIVAAFNALFTAIEVAGLISGLTNGASQTLITLANAATTAAQNYFDTLNPNSTSPQYVQASNLASYSSLISQNIQRGQTSRTLVVHGPADLCMIASQYYGDPSLGPALALANGIVGVNLSQSQVYTIALPPTLTG